MKKYILLIFLLAISHSIYAQLSLKDLIDTVYNKYDDNGQEHGLWFEYNSDSIITKKSYYKNGRLNGEQIQYYNGNMIGKVFYKNDTLHGNCISYDENGQVSSIQNFENGILNGIAIGFYQNRDTSYIENYKNGIAIGFYQNRDTSYIENYKNGKLEGISRSYFKKNKISSKILYKNGKVIEKTIYKENGDIWTDYIEKTYEISRKKTDTIIIVECFFDEILLIKGDNGNYKELCYDNNRLRMIRYYNAKEEEYKKEVFNKKGTFIKRTYYYTKSVLYKRELYNYKGKIKKVTFY